MPKTFHLTSTVRGLRLDLFLAQRLPELSRSYVKKLIDDGRVTVNGGHAKPALKLTPDDGITVEVPDPEPIDVVAEAIPLSIVYEDSDLVVVDKTAGMSVHPGPGHPRSTLVNALLGHCPDLAGIGGALRPGIVHRLDKDTSGLIIVAKTDRAHRDLTLQFKERAVEKTYVALARGRVSPAKGRIDSPLARDPRNRKRIAVVPGGRDSVTDYVVVERLGEHSLIEVRPKTGRTHQIRAHFHSIGHPLLGDALYGGRWPLLNRQFLHAARLRFRHPRTSDVVDLSAPLPPDLAAVVETLRFQGTSR